jgi:hypothetical protein
MLGVFDMPLGRAREIARAPHRLRIFASLAAGGGENAFALIAKPLS